MIERIIIIDTVDPQTFYGPNNANMSLIRNLYPKLRVSARGNVIKVLGEEGETQQFEKKIRELEAWAAKYNKLIEENIIDMVRGEAVRRPDADGVIIYGQTGRPISPRNANQSRMVRSFQENDLTFALGPAGTGKTYIAIALAVRALKNKECRRLILSRPAVEAGEKLGFLPGDMKDKIDPYLQPLYDALEDMLPPLKLKEYMDSGTIQIAPLAFMRGRRRHHTGRGAEHHHPPDENVPDPPGHEREDGHNGRRDADRPAAPHPLGPVAGAEHTSRSKGYRQHRIREKGHSASSSGAADSGCLRSPRGCR